MSNAGYLELFIGPMFSGKTTKLIELYVDFSPFEKITVIGYIEDTRYLINDNVEPACISHNRQSIPCIKTAFLGALWKDSSHPIHQSSVILIDEGQFYPDIYDIVVDMVENHHKRVYISGLDGDFQRKKFGKLLDLIPHCDNITKLTAICKCGEPAIFTQRISSIRSQKLIGSDDVYISLCRYCFEKTI
jgi:thymidine kinase